MDTVGILAYVKLVRNIIVFIIFEVDLIVVTKNFSTCFTDCSNRRCYLNIQENPQCCSRECAAGCTGPRDDQCIVSSCYGDNNMNKIPYIGM